MPVRLTPGQCIPPCCFLPQRLLHQLRRTAGGEGGSPRRGQELGVSDAQAAAGTEGPGSGAAAGRCWQGNAMVTHWRDAEHPRPPRAGAGGEKRGQWGRRGRAASPSCPTLLLCPICELSGTRLASSSSCSSSGLETPPPPGAGGAALGESQAAKGSLSVGMLREGVSDKRGRPFGCWKGVQTACYQPRHLRGTDISPFFLLSRGTDMHATQTENP